MCVIIAFAFIIFGGFEADPGGHIISMLAFGYLGYWAHRWDERAAVLIADKRAEIAERRRQRIARAEEASVAALAEGS